MTTPDAVSRKEDDDDDANEKRVAPEGDDNDIPFATPILGSWLYVGAEESVSASQRELLVELGVSHVVSIMKHPPPWLVMSKGEHAPEGRGGGGGGSSGGTHLPFEHLHVKVEDTKAANMSERFAEISAFISRAKGKAPPALRDGVGDGDGDDGRRVDGDDGRRVDGDDGRRVHHGGHRHGRVIVHCAFGWSRSVTAVAAHLVAVAVEAWCSLAPATVCSDGSAVQPSVGGPCQTRKPTPEAS